MAKNLYHGTTDKHLASVLACGLLTRESTRESNWETYPSRKDCVYLTDAYAPYFAWTAADIQHGEKALIVEVDSSALDEEGWLPDEDFIAQAIANQEKKSIDDVHAEVRDTLELYRHHAWDSLAHLGNICHQGAVAASTITRYATIDLGKQRDLAWACMDPSISLINYRICGGKYRSIISWIFGDRPDFEVGSGLPNEQYIAMIEKLQPGYADGLAKLFKNRDGINVVEVRT
jgi:hypothetical protein